MKQIKVEMKRDGLRMDADREDVAMAVKTYRLRRGITQAALGKEWGISRYSIIRIETAKPVSWEYTYKAFSKLAQALEQEGR